ncbi:MAG: hypothetical protein V2I33_19035 [Kangiellaceae bacterium]|nr:hypothetical protein [Kangiellaceae bacterium]
MKWLVVAKNEVIAWCDSKTKSDQYGECIDESFEYTRNEEENDRTLEAGPEYGGAPYLFEPRTDY